MTMEEIFKEIEDQAKITHIQTNIELAAELALITKLTANDIQKLLPKRADKVALSKLVKILKMETDRNNKLNALKGNFDSVGSAVLKILDLVL